MSTMDAGLFEVLRASHSRYRPDEIIADFGNVDEARVETLAESIGSYIRTNLPLAIERRGGLADYRTNPYVLMTSANVMRLNDVARFADFLFNNKLYMGLETSFGKSIESTFIGQYPVGGVPPAKWADPPEKIAEAASLAGFGREKKARLRTQSVWREIDKSCVMGSRRYLTSVKSGPNCINDTQVQAMTAAIVDHHQRWLDQSRRTFTGVRELDLVIGITYGTERTTNNKENQILAKLMQHGFHEEDRGRRPGVLIDGRGLVRVYRRIGRDFWAFIGNPNQPHQARSVFLEVLLALARALSVGARSVELEERINRKIAELSNALGTLMFPRESLPRWVRAEFSEDELFWFATALTAFYDEGI